MSVSRLGLAAVVFAAVSVLFAGCTTTVDPPESSKSLTIGVTLEPPTLDLTTSDAASIPQVLLYNVYETLLKIDSDGQIRPLLASAYQVSEDGLVYTFELDPAALFASGTPVDGDAVAASINQMREAPSQTWRSQMAVIADVVVVDAQTVQVILSQPSNFWLYSMTSTPGIIFDPALTDLATKPAGSGPYKLKDWVKGDQIILEKNPNYWATPGQFETVTFRYIPDPNAMVAAMLSGDLDIVGELTSPDSLPQFNDTAKYTVLRGTTNGEVVLGFNHNRPALQDLLVRQAICHAIDRQGLVDNVWGGQGELIGSMVVPTDAYYEDLSMRYPYDPDKARELLAQAGVTNLKLALRVPADAPYAPPAATYIASQLAEVGITATVEELDFGSRWLPEVFIDGDYDMTIVAHVEPRDIVNFANPNYYWHYDNPAFQSLIQQADAGPADQFVPTMIQAAALLADDAAADWLFVFPNLIVARAGLSGIGQNATTLSFDVTTISAKG